MNWKIMTETGNTVLNVSNPMIEALAGEYWAEVIDAVDSKDIERLYEAAISMMTLKMALESLPAEIKERI